MAVAHGGVEFGAVVGGFVADVAYGEACHMCAFGKAKWHFDGLLYNGDGVGVQGVGKHAEGAGGVVLRHVEVQLQPQWTTVGAVDVEVVGVAHGEGEHYGCQAVGLGG